MYTFKKIISLIILTSFPISGLAQDLENRTVTVIVKDVNDKLLHSSYQLQLDKGGINDISKKAYALTKCSETPKKKIRTFTSQQFSYGYEVIVDTQAGLVEVIEFNIDDSKYADYKPQNCFNGEVQQIVHKVAFSIDPEGAGVQQATLNSGNKVSAKITIL